MWESFKSNLFTTGDKRVAKQSGVLTLLLRFVFQRLCFPFLEGLLRQAWEMLLEVSPQPTQPWKSLMGMERAPLSEKS